MTELEFMEESIKDLTLLQWTRHFKEHDIEISPRALELAVEIHFEEMCQYALELEQGGEYAERNTGIN